MGGLISILKPKSRKQGGEKLVTLGHFIPFFGIHLELKRLILFSCSPEPSSMKMDKYLKFLETSVESFPCLSPIFGIETISAILRVGVVIK